MDGVATPIIGRPRPLPGHDTPNPAYHPHTLNYEEPHNLSSSWFPIHFVAAHAYARPHVGPMMCAWAAPPMRVSCSLRAYRGVNVQPLVASVASFRFQAGESSFLFRFLSFLLPGCGSSFLCRAFAFRLN